MINFFGFFKETNHIGISSVGFEKAAIYLRNRDSGGNFTNKRMPMDI